MRFFLSLSAVLFAFFAGSYGFAQELEKVLAARPAAELVKRIRAEGNSSNGAILFHQPHLACIKCHSVSGSPEGKPGPELTKLGPEVTAQHIVESILAPSKSIRKGFESLQVQLHDGRTIAGLIVKDSPEIIELRDADGRVVLIKAAEIEERKPVANSLMPAGLVNLLATESQFFDLARYLLEVHEGGVKRALELQPPAALLVLKTPEYEPYRSRGVDS